MEQPYEIIEDNWFKALPYAFKAYIDGQYKVFYLPISPQNISIVTHFASNLVATVTSTIEEHGEQRYFDIVIQGTTGFSPRGWKRGDIEQTEKKDQIMWNVSDIIANPIGSRESFASSITQDNTQGFATKTNNTINQIRNLASDMVNGRNHKIGVYNNTNGYVAFHNFYRFLLRYKKNIENFNKEENNKTEGDLIFMSYKDNCKYSCIVQRFVLERSADNPLLYNYNIQLRAYNLRSLNSPDTIKNLNTLFGNKSFIDERVLQADVKGSWGATARNMSRKIKTAINGVIGGIGTLGR
jgi:hypothetical protein